MDFENTLVPEFWPIAAEKLGIPEIAITSQDVPNQRMLMQKRIEHLTKHGVTIDQLEEIVKNEQPLPGARAFIERLRDFAPRILIVSDFEERLAEHFIRQFEGITFIGHRFVINEDRTIKDYDFRQDNPKTRVVEAMHLLNFEVYAAGDSFNDIHMLQAADAGYLINAPKSVRTAHPDIENTSGYDELLAKLTSTAPSGVPSLASA